MAKVALFFVLEKPTLPENFGIKMSLPAISPFYESIIRDSSVIKLNYADCTAYNFRFFRKPFQTDVLVILKDYDYQVGANIEESSRKNARTILEIAADKEFEDRAYTQRALWLPKGVTRQEFNNLTGHFSKSPNDDPETMNRQNTQGGWIMMHPDGFILGSKNDADFLKAAASNALALSFKKHYKDFLDKLSIAAATGSQLPKICADISRFQCQYGFKNPIDSSMVNESTEYRSLSSNLGVSELAEELNEKVAQAINLLQAQRLSNGSFDEVESFSAETKKDASVQRRQQITDEGQTNPAKSIIFTLILLAAAGSVAYLLGTDSGQKQWQSWTSQE